MKKIILSSAIVLSLAGTAIAQTPTTFADVDADTSGELSLTELQTVWPDMTDAEFGPADTDASGGLTVDELTTSPSNSAAAAKPTTGTSSENGATMLAGYRPSRIAQLP